MKNKILILTAIVMFVGASVTSGISANIKDTNSFSPLAKGYIYVDDDFNESTPGWNVTHFNKIQDGVDAAVNFDTVFVYNGTYNENVKIGTLVTEKKIDLIGEDRDNVFILGVTGEDAVVTVSSSDVEVNGFTIDGDSGALEGIRVSGGKQDNILTNNRITDCSKGVSLKPLTKRIEISDNIISNSEFAGIELQESDQNDIINNKAIQNNVGIQLSTASSQNSIEDNTVSNNDREGIILEGISNDNTLTGNNVTNNRGGVKLSSSKINTITSNNIQDNDMEGLLISLSNNNVIEKNNFINNKKQAAFKISWRNSWDENYWDNWIGLKINKTIFQKAPKVIRGIIRINFDWHPASVPYAI
ncbi:MAG: right-handed parallel beta-helix repeat-containing protein [Thermoplasmatales archaeon]|nr:MAG: right-handed parallel beta-helix repeat-containing protein [Thermoplasmatales archaeon]